MGEKEVKVRRTEEGGEERVDERGEEIKGKEEGGERKTSRR